MDLAKLYRQLEAVIEKISTLDNILPALFMLDTQDMDLVSQYYPAQRILELCIADLSLVGFLAYDSYVLSPNF